VAGCPRTVRRSLIPVVNVPVGNASALMPHRTQFVEA
jgi:hypothetical protein